MRLNHRHNRILLRQEDVPKDHEKLPILLLNQNTTLEISDKFNPAPGISHTDGFHHGFKLFNVHVDLRLINSTLYLRVAILPPTSSHRFRADARLARVFQYSFTGVP